MTAGRMIGTEGYAEEAETLLRQYEGIRFEDVHRRVRHLFPPAPCRVLDIGAGTGRDAAAFAALGYRVVAVEPTAAFRVKATELHPSPRIQWVDDGLPKLAQLSRRGEMFDLVMLTAVWMHLDAGQRRRAMPAVAALLASGGTMVLTQRHGPIPPGRRMFDVTAEETIGLAAAAGMTTVFRLERDQGSFGRPGISWDRLVFARTVAR